MTQKKLNFVEKRTEMAELATKEKRYQEAIVLYDEVIEKLRELAKTQFFYEKRAEEIEEISKKCKRSLRDEMIERCEFVQKEDKVSLVLEYVEIILNLSEEIEDSESVKKYKDLQTEYKKRFNEKMADNIQDIIEQANTYKNSAEYEKAKDLFETALKKACDLQDDTMIEALTEQVTLINSIFLKERRKNAIENAKASIKAEEFATAIENYQKAAKLSVDLKEPEYEQKFSEEIKRIEKLKDKLDKQRKKVDKQIDIMIEKADNISNQKKFFDAIKLYHEASALVKESFSQLEIDEGLNQKIVIALEKYFSSLFLENPENIPPLVLDLIKIAEELREQQGKFHISDLYQRAVKRILRPEREITSTIYLLHKLRILF